MGTRGITIIVPIAWRLDRDERGAIIVGPGTKEACDYAIRLARETPSSLILLTPTHAPADWDHVAMCEVMARYVVKNAPDVMYAISQAPWFNTRGEVTAAASFTALRLRDEPVEKVVFVVKSWHLPRLRMIVRIIFKGRGLRVPVEYQAHYVPAPFLNRVIMEVFAFGKNWVLLHHIGYR